MALAPEYLVDTNILLRLSRRDDREYPIVHSALATLDRQGAELYFSLQNIAELWNVCTRPIERNGYGLTREEVVEKVDLIERTMTLLPDTDQVYAHWRRLVVANNVRGAQVHDARLVALMAVYGVTRILTMNQPDFVRYSQIQGIHPSQVHA